MTRVRWKHTFGMGTCCLAMITALMVLPSAGQNTGAPSDSQSGPPVGAVAKYDVANEVTVQGTIAKVEQVQATAPVGTHMTLQSSSGAIGVHLGPSASADPSLYVVGQKATVTGMWVRIDGNSVLLARIVKTQDAVHILRNERGIPTQSGRVRRTTAAGPTNGGNF